MHWTSSKFPSECDFESDEDKNKHLLAPCEGIVKTRHTLLIQIQIFIVTLYI